MGKEYNETIKIYFFKIQDGCHAVDQSILINFRLTATKRVICGHYSLRAFIYYHLSGGVCLVSHIFHYIQKFIIHKNHKKVHFRGPYLMLYKKRAHLL